MERPRSSLSEVESTILFEFLWDQRRAIGAWPILLPDLSSSYGLPVGIGFREVKNNLRRANSRDEHGFIFTLFEDRSALQIGEIVRQIECIGWIVLTDYAKDKLTCWNSDLINEGRISETDLNNDPVFMTLEEKLDINAVTVGFNERFSTRRTAVLEKLRPEVRAGFADRTSTMNKRLHIQRGIGSILIGQAIQLARLKECNIQFLACNQESTVLLQKSAQRYNKKLLNITVPARGKCFELVCS